MLTKVQKWGNSLGLRIPKTIALDAKLENESVVEMELVDGEIIIKPVAEKKWQLDELVAKMTASNRHSEVDTGKPAGNEVW